MGVDAVDLVLERDTGLLHASALGLDVVDAEVEDRGSGARSLEQHPSAATEIEERQPRRIELAEQREPDDISVEVPRSRTVLDGLGDLVQHA